MDNSGFGSISGYKAYQREGTTCLGTVVLVTHPEKPGDSNSLYLLPGNQRSTAPFLTSFFFITIFPTFLKLVQTNKRIGKEGLTDCIYTFSLQKRYSHTLLGSTQKQYYQIKGLTQKSNRWPMAALCPRAISLALDLLVWFYSRISLSE